MCTDNIVRIYEYSINAVGPIKSHLTEDVVVSVPENLKKKYNRTRKLILTAIKDLMSFFLLTHFIVHCS